MTLKELSALHFESQKNKYSAPVYAIPHKKFSDKDANSLTEAILYTIKLKGGWCTRVSVEGRYIESIGKRIPSSVTKGTADLHAVYQGMHLSIEVKHGKDQLRPEQIKVMNNVIAAGGHYFVARNYEDFSRWFESLTMKGGRL